MTCFINLPLYWVRKIPTWADWFIAGGISPELGLDPQSLALPDSWHRDMAARFHAAGLQCAIHLPFMDIEPGSLDGAERRNACTQLARGAAIAKVYNATHMVGHPYFHQNRDSLPGNGIRPEWIEHSMAAWRDLPEKAEAPLFLENTYETSLKPLVALMSALHGVRGETNPETAAIGACFDIGHWHVAGHPATLTKLEIWLDDIKPFRLHLHLHDNHGTTDEHLGIGEGSIPFAVLFGSLKERNKTITATMEPHNLDSFLTNVSWLDKNPNAAQYIGWRGANIRNMPLAQIEKGFIL